MLDALFSIRKLLILSVFVCTVSYFTLKLIGENQITRPKEEWIIFSCSHSDIDTDLYRMLPDGSKVTQLTDSGDDESYPHWASESGWVYFWNGYGSGPDIRRMRFDGDGIESFVEDIYPNGFDVAPSEKFLVFARVAIPKVESKRSRVFQ